MFVNVVFLTAVLLFSWRVVSATHMELVERRQDVILRFVLLNPLLVDWRTDSTVPVEQPAHCRKMKNLKRLKDLKRVKEKRE